MKGKKKISDFFIDKKISIPDKQETLMLTCGSKIAAVLPFQIDDYFKVNENTLTILRIQCFAADKK
jgi:tRNA(Ile)-lysidine synthase